MPQNKFRLALKIMFNNDVKITDANNKQDNQLLGLSSFSELQGYGLLKTVVRFWKQISGESTSREEILHMASEENLTLTEEQVNELLALGNK